MIFLLDLITKGNITRYSILSHDPIIGGLDILVWETKW